MSHSSVRDLIVFTSAHIGRLREGRKFKVKPTLLLSFESLSQKEEQVLEYLSIIILPAPSPLPVSVLDPEVLNKYSSRDD